MKDSKKPAPELLRLPQVLELLPIHRATFYRGIQAGIYPKPIKVGAQASAWRRADILAAISARES